MWIFKDKQYYVEKLPVYYKIDDQFDTNKCQITELNA